MKVWAKCDHDVYIVVIGCVAALRSNKLEAQRVRSSHFFSPTISSSQELDTRVSCGKFDRR